MRIKIKIQDIDNEHPIELERVNSDDTTTIEWFGEVTIHAETYFIRFSEAPLGVINNLEKHPQIISSDEHIENQINMHLVSFNENEEGLVKPYCEHRSHNGRYILGGCMSIQQANNIIEDHYERTGHTETDYFTC